MGRLDVMSQSRQSPLEQFLCDYVAARDGMWDQVEPQVYDVLLEPDLIRVAFDPEALPEHPQAQLASFGSPLFDRLLSDAANRWNSAVCYRTGLHLAPSRIEARLARAIALPAGASLQLQRSRAMHFPQAVFWFRASFTSDQKENEVLPIGIDLHQLREVRHLGALLALERMSDEPDDALPEAPHDGLTAGYRVARAQAGRSLVSLGNARRRDWSGAVQKQINRMRGYYAQLAAEAAKPATRIADPLAAAQRVKGRQESIQREERLRIGELQRKSELRIELTLTNLLLVHQPKLLLQTTVVGTPGAPQPLMLVWDPLVDAIEPASCPACGQPTFTLEMDRRGLRCGRCPGRR